MLEIDVAMKDAYDEKKEEFVGLDIFKVRLEHSLLSLSKWESLWEIPFLGKQKKTHKQTLSYIECMLLDEIPPEVFWKLVEKHSSEIDDYVQSKQTATTVPTNPKAPKNQEVITSELIYYWMVSLNIPVELEKWHLTRLLTLIRVVNYKNDPKTTKMSHKDRWALNRERLKQYNSRG